eukprot:242164-Prymnesium_polylepis.1
MIEWVCGQGCANVTMGGSAGVVVKRVVLEGGREWASGRPPNRDRMPHVACLAMSACGVLSRVLPRVAVWSRERAEY